MTITSFGYSGTIGPNDIWAKMQLILGSQYWVGDTDPAGPVSGSSDGSRHVTVASGTLGGQGIYDSIAAAGETITLPTLGVNTYYLICANRNWSTPNSVGGTGLTTITYQNVGSTLPTTLPARTNTTPGVSDDQPLALVLCTAAGAVSLIYDLRNIGARDKFSMSSALATLPGWFSFLGYGITVKTGNVTWYNDYFNGWQADPTIYKSGPSFGNALSITPISGWSSAADLESRGHKSGNVRDLIILVRHAASATNPITFTSTSGNAAGNNLTPFTVGNPDFIPPMHLIVPIMYINASGGSYSGLAEYTSGGNFTIISGSPNTSIGQEPSGTASLRTSFSWIAES